MMNNKKLNFLFGWTNKGKIKELEGLVWETRSRVGGIISENRRRDKNSSSEKERLTRKIKALEEKIEEMEKRHFQMFYSLEREVIKNAEGQKND